MPLPLPMWPPISIAMPLHAPPSSPLVVPGADRRWIIVENSIRREVAEREYRAALLSCERVEVAHYPHEDVVTNVCYRGQRGS